MISNLKTFENKNFGKLTVIEKDGEFFFIANEVATMLGYVLSLIHISEPTRQAEISYAVFCLKKKKKKTKKQKKK